MVPAVIVIGIFGEGEVTKLLVLSQVILSFQLPFAVIPLIQFTSDKAKMGEFVNKWHVKAIGWTMGISIAALNVWLLYNTFFPAPA